MSDNKKIFDEEYMPYIIKWGKITTWVSLVFVFLPALAIYIFFDGRPTLDAVMAGLVSVVSAWLVWYVVDPVSLFPILGVPGMYITYIAGNSKEIRIPAALLSMDAAGVKNGTEKGTVVSCIGISVSVFISLSVMTLIAIAGQAVLNILPQPFMQALRYLLPALFAGLFGQRAISAPKQVVVIIVIFAAAMKFINQMGVFSILPFGGSYAQILLCVIASIVVGRHYFLKSCTEEDATKG